MSARPWVIIGTGQLGCSLARIWHDSGKAPALLGVESDARHREKAAKLGCFQQVHASLEEAVEDAAVILIATPMRALPALLEELSLHAPEDAVVTDVGSVKGWVVQQHRLVAPGLRFVPGHPIAGTEKSGPAAADAHLFQHKTHWLCPLPDSDAEALIQVEKLWRLAGADVQTMTYRLHDGIYARTSHSAQLLSWVLAECFARKPLFPCPNPALFRTLRIGGSDVTMWRDIFLTNSEALLKALRDVARNLERIGRGDEDGLLQALQWRQHARRIPTAVKPEWLPADLHSRYGSLLSPAVTLAAAYCMSVLQWQEELETSLIPYLGAGFLGVTRPAAAETLWWSAISPHIADELHQQLNQWIELIATGEKQEPALTARLTAAREAHLANVKALELTSG